MWNAWSIGNRIFGVSINDVQILFTFNATAAQIAERYGKRLAPRGW